MQHIDRRTLLKGLTSAGMATVGTKAATAHTDSFNPEDEHKGRAQGEDDWNSFSDEHLTFRYHDGYEDDAEQVHEWYRDAEDHGRDVFPDDVTIDVDVTVHVHAGEKWSRSDHSLYWTSPPPLEVHLQAPSDSPNGERWHRTGIGHEEYNIVCYNHWYEADIDPREYEYHQRNPAWFGEGLAEYVTNRQPETIDGHPDPAIEHKMEQIESGNGYFSQVADDQYHGGHLICEFLLEEHDYQSFFDLFVNDAETWGQALEEEFGMTQFELNLAWLAWAEENIGGKYLDGLSDASNALRTGDVSTDLLRDVIDAWRSDDPVS